MELDRDQVQAVFEGLLPGWDAEEYAASEPLAPMHELEDRYYKLWPEVRSLLITELDLVPAMVICSLLSAICGAARRVRGS